MLNAHQLGAALYVPATHPQLMSIARGEKLSHVRTLIYCTEDAVTPEDLPHALTQLQALLHALSPNDPRHHFIRLRNPQVMEHILALADLHKIRGFVLPKISAENLDDYAELLHYSYQLMPTLESADTFLEAPMLRLRELLLRPAWRERILCLRIGGNDLLSQLSMRRPRGATLYQTPIQNVIARLVGIFKPYGFYLSAPVCEFFDEVDLLAAEVQQDLWHGLTGKTAIHPKQIPLIEQYYRVAASDVALAHDILNSKQAVFNAQQTMQEVSTHSRWAQEILIAAQTFGEEVV